MGKRTRDEVIYSRVDYRVKQEFESQMKESGYRLPLISSTICSGATRAGRLTGQH